MQMDAEDDEPLNRGILAGSEQTATAADPSKSTQAQTDSSHPTEPDDINNQQHPDGPVATATDLALEQDA